jgi:hypothetical protein
MLLNVRNAAIHKINCIYSSIKLTKVAKYYCYLLAELLDTELTAAAHKTATEQGDVVKELSIEMSGGPLT